MIKQLLITLPLLLLLQTSAQSHEVSWYERHLPYHCSTDNDCRYKDVACKYSNWKDDGSLTTKAAERNQRISNRNITWLLKALTRSQCMSYD